MKTVTCIVISISVLTNHSICHESYPDREPKDSIPLSVWVLLCRAAAGGLHVIRSKAGRQERRDNEGKRNEIVWLTI